MGEAVTVALDAAGDYSWTVINTENGTVTVSDFEVVAVGDASLCYLNYREGSAVRGSDPFVLYPSWYVPLGFDKVYPGCVTGVTVRVWADTGEVSGISSLASGGALLLDEQPISEALNSEAAVWVIVSIVITGISGIAGVCFGFRRNTSLRLKVVGKLVLSKLLVVLLCLLISVGIVFAAVPPANAFPDSNGKSMIYASTYGQNEDEANAASEVCNCTSGYFSSAGYDVTDAFGTGTTKEFVLGNASSMEEQHLRVALFHFGHGGGYWMGQPYNCFAYFDFFDNDGDLICAYEPNDPYGSIYEETVLGRHFFVFIWTCLQGQYVGIPSYPFVGMPLAWTQNEDISGDGYFYPDDGLHCFIGFEGASPTLTNSSFKDSTVEGKDFIMEFYYFALIQNCSVNDALDSASENLFSTTYDDCPLYDGFETWWPYDYGEGMGPDWYEGMMHVYGNGNIYLCQVLLTFDTDPEFEENVYIDGQQIGTTGQSFYVNAGPHEIEVSVPEDYVFLHYTYSGGSSTSNPAVLSFSSDMTVTACYSEDEDHSLTVLAYNQYMQQGYVPLWIDDEYVGTTGYFYTVEAGYHAVEVEEIIWDYPYIHTFDHYEYDSTTNYNNPISLPITDDKTVTAYYNTYIG